MTWKKRRRTIEALLLFCLVIVLFCVGLVLHAGDRKSWWSIVAALCCIPAALLAVQAVALWMQHPAEPDLCRRLDQMSGEGICLYNLCVTAGETLQLLDLLFLRGNHAAIYCSSPKADQQKATIQIQTKRAMQMQDIRGTATVYTDQEVFFQEVEKMIQDLPADPETEACCAAGIKQLSL